MKIEKTRNIYIATKELLIFTICKGALKLIIRLICAIHKAHTWYCVIVLIIASFYVIAENMPFAVKKLGHSMFEKIHPLNSPSVRSKNRINNSIL
jgi:hypothetical protein